MPLNDLVPYYSYQSGTSYVITTKQGPKLQREKLHVLFFFFESRNELIQKKKKRETQGDRNRSSPNKPREQKDQGIGSKLNQNPKKEPMSSTQQYTSYTSFYPTLYRLSY